MDSTEAAVRDSARLAALRRLELLDTPPDVELDRLTQLAHRVLRAPLAVVCLVDAGRQYFHSAVGLPEPIAGRRETPLSHSICKHVVTTGRPLAVGDARGDALLRDNLAVTELGVVAYAGRPLVTADGHVVGTLAVMDFAPRAWRPDELELLEQLAASAWTHIELSRTRRELERQADALRREHEERDAVLRHVADVVYGLATDGTILSLSMAFESVTGWPSAEWVGRPLVLLLHPDDRPRVQEVLSRAVKGEPVPRFEARVRSRSGEYLVGEFTATAQVENGTVRRLLGVVRDITGRRQVGEQVTPEAERWTALMDHLPDTIYFKDKDGRFTRINRAQARVLGVVDPGEAVGKSDADFFPPAHAAAALADERAIMASGEPLVSKIERVEDPGGRQRWFSTTKLALKSLAGEVVGRWAARARSPT